MAPRTLCRYCEPPYMVATSTKIIHRRRWLRAHNALTPENLVDNELYEPENTPELEATDYCTTNVFEPIESNDFLEDSPESIATDDNFTDTSEYTVAYDSSEYSSESDEDLQDLPELSDLHEDVFNSNPGN
ncbi:hypothetical protein K3495_g16716 [Podosphaera aphanis]|nr:hypothetical protein K3495_g16716 [Podosphaera aphanis]